ncbi:hypothetical protein TNCV_3195801 [Trichonephila clavipes]|nr:hypothetical protein TNCV_3195801 [Trichonephila clavipes]
MSKKTMIIVLMRDLLIRVFLGRGDDLVCHSQLCLFDSGSYSNIQDSSPKESSESPVHFAGYDRVQKVRFILNQFQQFLTAQNSLLAASGMFRLHFFQASRKTLWHIVVQANAPSRYVTKVENTLQAEARISVHTARTQLTTGCIEKAYPPPHFPAGFTVLQPIVASQ